MKVEDGEDREQIFRRFKAADDPVRRLFDSLLQHTQVPHEFE